MRNVMQTWDSVYWLAPRSKGIYIKLRNMEFGLGKNVKKLYKTFPYSKYEHRFKLFNRVK